MAAVADRIHTDAQHRIQIRGALAPGYAEILTITLSAMEVS